MSKYSKKNYYKNQFNDNLKKEINYIKKIYWRQGKRFNKIIPILNNSILLNIKYFLITFAVTLTYQNNFNDFKIFSMVGNNILLEYFKSNFNNDDYNFKQFKIDNNIGKKEITLLIIRINTILF